MSNSTAAQAAEGVSATAVNDKPEGLPKTPNKSVQQGETEAKRILQAWNSPFIGDAAHAAFNVGLLVSANLLPLYRANSLLEGHFKRNSCNPDQWDIVLGQLYQGRETPVLRGPLLERIASASVKTKDRFQITWFDDVDQSPAKEELLEGVLGVGEFTVLVAKPGGGKSVLAADIGCHIAADKEWHGRKVKPGLVVFFAAERKRLTERRVAAWRKYHGVESIPFVVVGGKLDLTTGLTDAKALIETVKALEVDSEEQCVLIVLDTVTRTFGPADQHQSKDMGRYIQSVDEIARAIGAHILAVHHSPWSDDRGKGAIDLDGAVDASFVIKPAGKTFSFECTGSNDGAEEKIMAFKMESVPLGIDANGNETTAPVVVPLEGKLWPAPGFVDTRLSESGPLFELHRA